MTHLSASGAIRQADFNASEGVIDGEVRRHITLDSGQLLQFAGGDGELALALLDDFLSVADGYVADLQEAGRIFASDPEMLSAGLKRWQEQAHRLKGAARSIGAWTLAGLAADAEQITGGRDAADAMCRVLAAAVAELRAIGHPDGQ